MEKPLSLTILYTANLRGDSAILPRLFTLLERLKASAAGTSLIFDLGRACDASVWHCRETGGRSMLILLDGMGYHAANVAGALDERNREKLAAQVTMALIDETHTGQFRVPAHDEPLIVGVRPDEKEQRFQINLTPAARSEIVDNALRLQDIRGGQIGAVEIELATTPRITRFDIRDLPGDTPPNPTIAGAVEFVEAEARLFQRKRMRDRTP